MKKIKRNPDVFNEEIFDLADTLYCLADDEFNKRQDSFLILNKVFLQERMADSDYQLLGLINTLAHFVKNYRKVVKK